MNKIKILAPHEAQKIAAGEVVERPANIVKELIENSLDADAGHVALYFEQAGKTLIRIVDDGCGMSPEDARLCFVAHATSKIEKLDDLATLNSFGFRGEALASIAAVSKVTLITRLHDHDLGTKLVYHAGVLVHEEAVACAAGTEFLIEDLFFNIPARKKFLKRDETEWNHLLNLVQAFCLSNLLVSFKMFHDGRLVLNAPAVKTLHDRASQLWDYNFSQNLIELASVPAHKQDSWFSLRGVITGQHFWRYGRTQQFFFVNGRWVKDHDLSKALLKGYQNVLPPGRFPAAFIFVDVEQEFVDINVHPKKEEVRFTKPVTVHMRLQELVKNTLEQSVSKRLQSVPTLMPAEPAQFVSMLSTKPREYYEQAESKPLPTPWQSSSTASFVHDFAAQNVQAQPAIQEQEFESALPVCQQEPEYTHVAQPVVPFELSAKLIGQLFKTYLVLDREEELVIIDQHAAHERILYEHYLKNFEQKEGVALLFPELVQLPDDLLKLVVAEREFFLQQGIELEQFGKNEIALKSSPPGIQNHSLRELVLEIASFIQEHERLDRDVFRKKLNEHTHGQMACKAAVKAGDELSEEQMKQLVSSLKKTNNRFICVHGRPTTWTLSKHDLEKHFRRC
ncbi:DNA mismatch repair endonuclease MutL [Candidatus Babeliales bacterium]|nr:DNA mismatch repair endonuclease MutL [Candidatus Babeliales bacterium]